MTPDTAIRGTFHLFLAQGNPGPADIRYIVLLNERQIAAFEDASLSHDLSLQPGERASFEVQLPPLSVGIHDLIVLGIVQGPLTPGGNYGGLVYRSTLVAGDNAPWAAIDYQRLEPDRRKWRDTNFFPLGVHLDESQTAWAWPDVYHPVTGSALDVFVSAGYMENTGRLREFGITPFTTPFALVAFLDGEQVPLRHGDITADVLHLAVEPGNLYSFVPLSIDAPGRAGRSELMVLRINYPRTPMCWLFGNPQGYYFDNGIYTQRVGVDFRPSP